MSPCTGTITVPGDKSISHRALIFSVFSRGRSKIFNCSPAEDVASSAACLARLGLKIERLSEPEHSSRLERDSGLERSGEPGRTSGNTGATCSTRSGEARSAIIVDSDGIEGLKACHEVLFAGNSGTTMRLMAGLAAGRPFKTRFDGDASLRRRTMKRVLDPLIEMGAIVEAKDSDYAPFEITGGALSGKAFELKVASAQVEACILLAGLQAEGETSVKAPYTVRDHTRRMFSYLGIPYGADNGTLFVKRLEKPVAPFELVVPADISSAAFFMVASSCLPGSDLILKNVGVNPGRTLILDVLKEMGAHVEIIWSDELCGEPVSDIRVKHSRSLSGITLGAERVASGIDELPVIALAGALCNGEFVVSGAEELRHKESDRIKALCDNLKAAGVDVDEKPDGFVIRGKKSIPGGSQWLCHGDHRLAMTGVIASLLFERSVSVDDESCISVSYPGFRRDLKSCT